MGKLTEARIRATRKWNAANYYRVGLTVPKAWETDLKQYVANNNTTINKLLNGFIAEKLGKNICTNTSTSEYTNSSTPIEYTNNSVVEYTNISTLPEYTNTSTSEYTNSSTSIEYTNNSVAEYTNISTLPEYTNTSTSEYTNSSTPIKYTNNSTSKGRNDAPLDLIIKWYELNKNGTSFGKIATMPDGGGYHRTTIAKAVSRYKKNNNII